MRTFRPPPAPVFLDVHAPTSKRCSYCTRHAAISTMRCEGCGAAGFEPIPRPKLPPPPPAPPLQTVRR